MEKLNVAVVGCGIVSNDHLKAWNKIDVARVAAVCDLDEKLAKNAAELYNVPKYYTSLAKLFEENKIDIVDVCTPPQTHAPIGIQAMDAGCNVILEKPMTSTLEDAKKIVEHQKKTGLKVGVIHNWLFEPPVVEANNILKKGQLGEIFHVEVEALHTVNDQMTADPNHWSHKHPGGRFGEMIAHPLYLLRHFLGEVKITNLQASKIGDLEWMTSDELIMSVVSDKKFGEAYVSFNSPRKAIYINIYGKDAILTLDVINAVTTILPAKPANRLGKGLDSLKQATQLITDTGKNVSKIAFNKWWSGHEMFLKLFAESIVSKTKSPVTVQDGYVVMKVLDEACKLIEKEQVKE